MATLSSQRKSCYAGCFIGNDAALCLLILIPYAYTPANIKYLLLCKISFRFIKRMDFAICNMFCNYL